MQLVVDTLRISTVTDELNDYGAGIIAGLFDVENCKAGEAIVKPADAWTDNL